MVVFHHIGKPSEDKMTHSIKQILECDDISFDGAYECVWTHREQLKGKEPILFVQGETVGTEGVCTSEQIKTLANEYGFILGWHGWSHRKLTELEDHVIIKELTAPREFSKLYAYPHGEYDERVKKIVKDMGFLRAYSTTQGDNDDFSIRREYL